MKRVATAIAAAGLIATSAFAADLNKPVYRPPPPPPLQDWSGIYVGLEGGYGWGKQNTDTISPGDQFSPVFNLNGTIFLLATPLFFPDVAVPSINQKGWLAGGFFGAQKQWSSWVLGIEGDIDAANVKGSGTSNATSASANSLSFSNGGGFLCFAPCFTFNHNLSIDSKIDALASLRGKVGWSFAPDWLIYGTGGAAFAHVENTVVSTESATTGGMLTGLCFTPGNFDTCTIPNFSLNASDSTTMFGWAAGGGIDWKLQLDAGSALVFGVEYLHYGFPDQTITLSENAGGILAFRAKENVDAVKGRISYLFSIH